MTNSDWINLGVAIGTILLALLALISLLLSLKENKTIRTRRNEEIFINKIIDWTNRLDKYFDDTDDKQSLRDFIIGFMPFVSPTENIIFIGRYFAKKYPDPGKELNDEIENLLASSGTLSRINIAFAQALDTEEKSKKCININLWRLITKDNYQLIYLRHIS